MLFSTLLCIYTVSNFVTYYKFPVLNLPTVCTCSVYCCCHVMEISNGKFCHNFADLEIFYIYNIIYLIYIYII